MSPETGNGTLTQQVEFRTENARVPGSTPGGTTKEITMYEYRAVVDRVVDGDTVDVTVDLGFTTYSKQRLRLARIDAPEVRGEEKVAGKAASRYLETMLREGDEVRVRTAKTGKYGRYIAEIWTTTVEPENISDVMVKEGHAVYREY